MTHITTINMALVKQGATWHKYEAQGDQPLVRGIYYRGGKEPPMMIRVSVEVEDE